MVILDLPERNYYTVESIKKQIVIGHTNNNNMNHIKSWLFRYNGMYKKTAPFTITKSGEIYNHFNPKYQSDYFDDIPLNSKTIVILLENEGWLKKNGKRNEYVSWIGDIYKEPDNVVEKKWRDYNYWAPYTEEQMESTIGLVYDLCDEFYIPLNVIGHNTKIDELDDYSGILYKSNIDKFNTDLSPAFDFKLFKEKIEKNKIL